MFCVITAVLAAAFGLPLMAMPAYANVPIVVTTTADVVDGTDGLISLREAVSKANDDAGADTIQLAADETYELSVCSSSETAFDTDNAVGDLDATDTAGLTVLGNGSILRQTCAGHRIFQSGVLSTGSGEGPDTALTVDDTHLDQGFTPVGGSIAVVGSLTLTDCVLTHVNAASQPNLSASAVLVSGDVDLTRTQISDNVNVGGVHAGADVDVTDSLVARNGGQALYAGGVWGDGDVTVMRSSIQDNSVTGNSNWPGDWGNVGGVNAVGTLTITDSEISGNTGQVGGAGHHGIGGGGALVVVRSRVHDNHGAIGGGLGSDMLDVRQSTIDSNDAAEGGGITGSGHIEDSTVANNHSIDVLSGDGAGFAAGGLYLGASTQLVRTTITGNTAATGSALLVDGWLEGPTIEVIDSTISGNPLEAVDNPTGDSQAEIFGQPTHLGTLLASGSVVGAAAAAACALDGISVVSEGYNFWSDSSCEVPPAWGDVVNGGDPKLGPLQDNGGPTPTRLPSAGSPLRDRIPLSDVGCAGVDQRGVSRPQGLGCDIGATEVAVPPSGFVGVAPKRILDTRTAPVPSGWPSGQKLSAGGTIDVTVAGANGVPADATALVLNVTSTQATSELGYVSVWPTGQLPPPTSALNLQPGANVANSVTVAPGVDGKVTLFTNAGATHLIIDVLGYYVPTGGDGFTAPTPWRVLDTRTGPVPAPWVAGQKLAGGQTLALPLAGVSVPADASAVVVNITSTEATSDLAYVTAWPAGQPRPTASNVNLQPQYNVSNLAFVELGVGGAIDLYTNAGATHLVVDVVGYFRPTEGDGFLPLNPARLFDSRSGAPLDSVTPAFALVADTQGIPSDARSVVLNATSTQASSNGGYLTLVGKGEVIPKPTPSNLNYRPPFNAPNQVISRVGQDHSVAMQNGYGTVHVVLDANGYFVASSP
jgi:hypothetical protein